jgi:hypothetical protein
LAIYTREMLYTVGEVGEGLLEEAVRNVLAFGFGSSYD